MHKHLINLFNKQTKERTILGLMSGTSLDGLDIALCKINGNGKETQVKLIEFESCEYEQDYLNYIQPLFANSQANLHDLTIANEWVARKHSSLIQACLHKWQIDANSIDLVASHGQTVYHAPNSYKDTNGSCCSATLQIGDGDHLSYLLGVPVVSDFRQKHVAAFGEGAPLVPYSDFLIYNHKTENRLLLNIGGIANYTYIPAKGRFSDVQFQDTGPGNTLMDQLITFANSKGDAIDNTYQRFDKGGELAKKGEPNTTLLQILYAQLARASGDKKNQSTGQELYNLDLVKFAWLELQCYEDHVNNNLPTSGTDYYNLLATLNRFTAQSIVKSLTANPAIAKTNEPIYVYVSGGGAHNSVLVENLESEFKLANTHAIMTNVETLSITADAKEAVMFAVLANESIYGNFADFSDDTNTIATSLGKISLP